jgi:hypothetical protein
MLQQKNGSNRNTIQYNTIQYNTISIKSKITIAVGTATQMVMFCLFCRSSSETIGIMPILGTTLRSKYVLYSYIATA